ncbi:hypothetical protein ONE63_002637 [Megalurothrips usitatus]|uniref:Sex-regulated protein janus-A n=1 Tax=Megalurothrips usitatus TaxID=439358 RepID=A0AAV7XFX4_9NEOP|nr:hypothetical protein ONE63_002637 [Megalurothrips usitatus]
MEDAWKSIPTVSIDDDGVFKYVLIKVHKKEESAGETEKTIVRGYKWASWHADIYEETQGKIEKQGLETECVGGGRIEHKSNEKKLKVYGYSQGYGKADHAVTTELLKAAYPDYEITWTDDGY